MFLAREIPGNWICEGISCYRLVTEWQVLYGDVHKECLELGGRLAKIEKYALELGVELNEDASPMAAAAVGMWLFDGSVEKLPGGYDTGELSPNSPVRELKSFPQDLVLVGRSTILVKGLSNRLGIPWSLAQEWAPIARTVLNNGRVPTKEADSSDRVRFREVWGTLKLWGSGRARAVAKKLPDPVRTRLAGVLLKLQERRARRKLTKR